MKKNYNKAIQNGSIKMNAKQVHNYIKGLQTSPLYTYTREEIDECQKFIENNYGECAYVWHELYSPDIHLDILVIPPSEEKNYYKLITMGMGAYKMNVPDLIKDYNMDRTELVIFLPPDWNMDLSKETNEWVISLLKGIARLPISRKTWLGFGHSISHPDEESYAKNTKFSASILVDAMDKNGEQLSLDLKNKGKINFYQVFPLYKEELEYKLEYGVKKLFEKLGKVSLVVDINRKNCCKEFNNGLDNIDKEMI